MSPALQSLPGNWYEIAKDYVRKKSEQDAAIKRHQNSLGSTSPSIMFGPPPDLLGELDKQTDLEAQIQLDNSMAGVKLNTGKTAFRGLGVGLGDSCFLGLKAVSREDIERAAARGDSAPLFGLSCDF